MPEKISRPIIGIPCSIYPDTWFTPAYGNATSYLRAIEAAGGIPMLIHLTGDTEVLDTHYQRCDALLFAGGNDVHPSFYGASEHPKLGDTNVFQDEVERVLVQRAIACGRPVLGICRGMQLINVVLGGSLYQDIASELPNAFDHQASIARRNMAYLAHTITLDATAWLAERLDTTELAVNTLHHQALRTIAPSLQVVARAPDGIVEAVEGVGTRAVIGVQCHPEELWEAVDKRWMRVFEGFVQLARQARTKKEAPRT